MATRKFVDGAYMGSVSCPKCRVRVMVRKLTGQTAMFSRKYAVAEHMKALHSVDKNAWRRNPSTKRKKPRTAAQKAATARMLAANAKRRHVRTPAQKKARRRKNTVPGYYPNPGTKAKKMTQYYWAVHWASQPPHIHLGVFQNKKHAVEVAQDLANRYRRQIAVSSVPRYAL